MNRSRGLAEASVAAAMATQQRAAVVANAAMAVRAYERQVIIESRRCLLPVRSTVSAKRGARP